MTERSVQESQPFSYRDASIAFSTDWEAFKGRLNGLEIPSLVDFLSSPESLDQFSQPACDYIGIHAVNEPDSQVLALVAKNFDRFSPGTFNSLVLKLGVSSNTPQEVWAEVATRFDLIPDDGARMVADWIIDSKNEYAREALRGKLSAQNPVHVGIMALLQQPPANASALTLVA